MNTKGSIFNRPKGVSFQPPLTVLDVVAEATDRIAEVSGLQFRQDPALQHVAERDIPYSGITIAWLPRAQFHATDPTTIGNGGADWAGTKYTSGHIQVLVDWPGAQRADFSAGGVGPLLLHEIGHALGLNHIDDPNAVMFPVNKGASSWSPAEQAALRYLKQACG